MTFGKVLPHAPLASFQLEEDREVPPAHWHLPTASDPLDAGQGSSITCHPRVLVSLLCIRGVHLFMGSSHLQTSINVQGKAITVEKKLIHATKCRSSTSGMGRPSVKGHRVSQAFLAKRSRWNHSTLRQHPRAAQRTPPAARKQRSLFIETGCWPGLAPGP